MYVPDLRQLHVVNKVISNYSDLSRDSANFLTWFIFDFVSAIKLSNGKERKRKLLQEYDFNSGFHKMCICRIARTQSDEETFVV